MADSGPYYFLLKTENYEPLLELVNKLTKKIEENQSIIDNLAFIIDNKIKFPILPTNNNDFNVRDNQKKEEKESVDILRGILNEKYKLDSIKLPNDDAIDNKPITNQRIKQLIKDNEKLKLVHQLNNKKNKELFKIIKDYEMFIVETILPSLRSDIESYQINQINSNLKGIQLPQKFNGIEKLWQRYIKYFEYLTKLTKLCEKLINSSNNEINNKEINLLQQKLIIINDLKLYIQNDIFDNKNI